jgi:hypothetical protein
MEFDELVYVGLQVGGMPLSYLAQNLLGEKKTEIGCRCYPIIFRCWLNPVYPETINISE